MKVTYYELEYMIVDCDGNDVYCRPYVGSAKACLAKGLAMLASLLDRAPEQFSWYKPESLNVVKRTYSGTPTAIAAAIASHSAEAVTMYSGATPCLADDVSKGAKLYFTRFTPETVALRRAFAGSARVAKNRLSVAPKRGAKKGGAR